MSAEQHSGLQARSLHADARRWIDRQLRWERTLDALRGDRRESLRSAA